MSESNSTDELVNYLLPAEGLGVRLLVPPEVSDAIIAKLRAGDKLYEAAKDEVIRTHGYYLRKAIAEYEGE